jgi:pyruvate,water dikinase
MHFPHPISPLAATSLEAAFSKGFTAAAREMQAPVREHETRFRNHYRFERFLMAQPASEDEARKLGEAAEATAKMEIGRLLERWQGEHLPRLNALHERLRTMDVADASRDDLAAMLDEVEAINAEMWTIHFRIAIPMLLALQLFDELYTELFEGTDAEAHALLVGVSSESVKAGIGLSELARSARELGLADLIRETPAESLLPTLQERADGRAFLEQLRSYLKEYGLRQDLFDLATPTWQEDPAFALASIRNYLTTGRDAAAEHTAMAAAAEAAAAASRAQLAMFPEAVRGQFEAMLQFARHGAFLQEEHNFYIDQRGLSLTRLFYLRLGERLARDGWLAAPDDIFMLTSAELRGMIANAAADTPERIQALVLERREELAIARTLTPPPFIGPPPEGPPPASNPFERAFVRFFGGPPQEAETPGQLKGNAGSRGIATGPARVARTLEEATAVLPGEVLVAVTTMPPWTPLFGIAAAVVTETGGPLSHCAIVAREYGIPAVVGAHGATRVIATGQQVTVDGGRGIVTFAD